MSSEYMIRLLKEYIQIGSITFNRVLFDFIIMKDEPIFY